MGPWSVRQLAALGAVAAAIILVVGFVIPGSPPHFAADAPKLVGFFHNHHKKVLVSLVLVEIGVALLSAVYAQLAILPRAAGQQPYAAVVGIAGAVSAGTLAVGYGLYGGLAQLAMFGQDAAAVPPLYRLIQFTQVGWYWSTFLLAAAVALAAWNGVFPRWVAAVDALVALLLVLGGISVKASGALAAGTGALATIGGIAFVVWVLHLGLLFWWQPAEVPRTASA
jgi:hypothetical protein